MALRKHLTIENLTSEQKAALKVLYSENTSDLKEATCSLVKLSLTRLDLRLSNISGKNLMETSFLGSDLRGANIACSSLIRTNFSNANLLQSDFGISAILSNKAVIIRFSFSPDGNFLASIYDQSHFVVWNLNTSQRILTIKAHDNKILSLSYSHDGHFIVTGSIDTTFKIWESHTGQLLVTNILYEAIISISVLPGDQYILFGLKGGYINLYDRTTGSIVYIQGEKDNLTSLSTSPNGEYIALTSINKEISLYTYSSEGVKFDCFLRNKAVVNVAAFSLDNKFMACAGREIAIWNMQNKTVELVMKGHLHKVFALSFSKNGSMMLSGSFDRSCKVWDFRTGCLLQNFEFQNKSVKFACFSPDGQFIASGSGKSIRIWKADLSSYSWDTRSEAVLCVCVSPDGKYILSGGQNGSIKIWDRRQGYIISSIDAHHHKVKSLVCSLDGKYFYSGSICDIVKWNMETKKIVKIFKKHDDYVNSLVLSKDGKLLFSASSDSSVCVFKTTPKFTFLLKLQGHSDRVRSIVNHGNLLFSASIDHSVRIWNLESGECMKVLNSHNSPVISIGIDNDGKVLVSGSSDNVLTFWQTQDDRILRSIQLKGNLFNALKIKENNIFAATNKQILIANIERGEVTQVLGKHKALISSMAIYGDLLISGSISHTIKVWKTRSDSKYSIKEYWLA